MKFKIDFASCKVYNYRIQKGGISMRCDARCAFALLRGSWKTLLLFEILFRLFSTYLVFPVSKWLFNSCLRITGFNCLTADNLLRILTNPVMLACFAVIFLLFSLTTIIEISCLITCLHSAQVKSTLGIFQLILEGLQDSVRLLRPRNLPLLLVTALLIPITQLPTSTSPLRLINLPWKALADYAVQFPYVLGIAAYILGGLIFFGCAMCIYHCYVLEDVRASKAFSCAFRMNTGRRLRQLIRIILLMAVTCAVVFGGSTLISAALNQLIPRISDDLNLQYRIRLPFDVVLGFIKSSLPPIICYACISAVYYSAKEALGDPIPGQALPYRKNAAKFNTIIFYIVIAVTALCIVLYDTVLRPTLVRIDALEYMMDSPTLIIAHRGNFADSDENTLSAFRSAIELGVDYVELDVQQTADGVVIVNHDSTFKRVFGDSRKVWEMTYDEVRALAAPVSGECPPTLYEVLTLLDPHANLLIELKNNGHNPDLSQAVCDILNEYQCFDRCIIQSTSYRMLREFKALAPDVRCGYILSFALGQYASLAAADFFSIDAGFISETVVSNIHRLGKDLYAWTVNDEPLMRQMQALGVDGIITDDAPLAKATLLSLNPSPLEELISEPLGEVLNPVAEVDEP